MNRHIIWQDSVYEDEEQWAEAYHEEVGDECMNLSEFIADRVAENLDDERANLSIEVPEGIIVIADLGLWNGRCSGRLKDEPTNVRDCLCSHCDGYMKFFVEDGEFMAEESHHDGTNRYTFRKWRPGLSEEQKDELRANVDDGSLIEKCTESLAPEIARVYGW